MRCRRRWPASRASVQLRLPSGTPAAIRSAHSPGDAAATPLAGADTFPVNQLGAAAIVVPLSAHRYRVPLGWMLGGTSTKPPVALTSTPGASLPALFRMQVASGYSNHRCAPRAVNTVAVSGKSPCSDSSLRSSTSAAGPSTSTTNIPDSWPVAAATLRLGSACHQRAICSGSTVASLKPCGVAGSFARALQGKTWMPIDASASAAAKAGGGVILHPRKRKTPAFAPAPDRHFRDAGCCRSGRRRAMCPVSPSYHAAGDRQRRTPAPSPIPRDRRREGSRRP